jgi:hypothetical protein
MSGQVRSAKPSPDCKHTGGSEPPVPAGGITVAALYIDPRGPYPKMPGVECWDVTRDARNYAGPWPVVAHPPCGPWGQCRPLCTKQDRALGLIAVGQVRRWGGVLEHPRHSTLLRAAELPLPGELPDTHGGVTVEVDQCDFGHVARKPTWLYCVGVKPPPHRLPRRAPARSVENCSREQRRRTPPAFAEWLVALARSVRRSEAA